MTQSEADRVAASDATVSDKIRALDRAGYSRSQIATLLGKHYTQVRNVLVNDERKRKGAASEDLEMANPHGQLEEPGSEFRRTRSLAGPMPTRIQVHMDGSLRLPEDLAAALDVKGGGVIMAKVDAEGVVTLISARTAMRQAQDTMRGLIPPGVSLVDELLADRRAEARREAQE